MSNKATPHLSEAQFDTLYSWLQEQCKERHALSSGVHYTCDHTFEHTRHWLMQRGYKADAYLDHLRAHHLSCDCAILRQLTDWP